MEDQNEDRLGTSHPELETDKTPPHCNDSIVWRRQTLVRHVLDTYSRVCVNDGQEDSQERHAAPELGSLILAPAPTPVSTVLGAPAVSSSPSSSVFDASSSTCHEQRYGCVCAVFETLLW